MLFRSCPGRTRGLGTLGHQARPPGPRVPAEALRLQLYVPDWGFHNLFSLNCFLLKVFAFKQEFAPLLISPGVGPGKPNLPLGLQGKAGGCAGLVQFIRLDEVLVIYQEGNGQFPRGYQDKSKRMKCKKILSWAESLKSLSFSHNFR